MKTLKSKSTFLLSTRILMASLLLFVFQTIAPAATEQKKIKIGLMMDTSNSMDGLIEQAKSQLWNVVNELAKAECDGTAPNISIALYEYGNDELASRDGYVRLISPLTNDLDQISADLFALKTNGGSEFCGTVIHKGVSELDWGKDEEDFKVIFIAGNESFEQGPVAFRKACEEAQKKGIIINTIFCGNFDVGIRDKWKEGADLTGGSYMSIKHNRKTTYIDSPYDQKITQLNQQLNETYIYYGREGKTKKKNQAVQDRNSMSYGTANCVQRTISKSSHVYDNASWDIIDRSEEKDFDISKIENKYLPENMQKMTKPEKLVYIEQQKNKRAEIKNEIKELNQERTSFIAKKKKALGIVAKATLNAVMLTAIRKQAKAKRFIFKDSNE